MDFGIIPDRFHKVKVSNIENVILVTVPNVVKLSNINLIKEGKKTVAVFISIL